MKNKLLISFLIFLSFSMTPVLSEELEDATVLYNTAIDYFKQDEVEKSLELFNRAIEINPDFYEAHYNLAQILMSLNKDEEALKVLEKAVELKKDDTDSLYNIGKIEFRRGYLSRAHEYLTKIPSTAPQFESAKLLIAKIESRQKELNLEAKIKDHKNTVNETGKAIGEILAEINAPSGIAHDSRGNIFVASFVENVIYKISIYGQKTVFSKSNLIKGPIGLAIDKEDNLYVANYNVNNIVKITPTQVLNIFADIQKPYCLIYDELHNRLYATEQNTNKLMKYDL